MNNLFYLILLAPLISLPFLMDDSFGCTVNCSEVDYMRIMAGYDTYQTSSNWWIDHHLTGFWGYATEGQTGFDAVTLDRHERSLKPSFIVKSFTSNESVTATYDVTYQVENRNGKVTDTGTNSYTNIFFHSNFDGEADTFPSIGFVPRHSTITYTIDVKSMR